MGKRSKKRKNHAPVVAPVLKAKQAAAKISPTALAYARNKAVATTPVTVFALPDHPAGVVPAGAEMAMDNAIPGVQTWANGFSNMGAEGIAFFGFSVLAELAQRPEYRMMTETIATEMTRKWISFTSTGGDDKAKADRIKQLDAEFKRLNVQELFCKATEQDGYFGRGHIYVDTGDTDNPDELSKPIGNGWDALSKSKVNKRKPIKALRTVEAMWCYPFGYNTTNPLKDNWYRPDSWYTMGFKAHSSRFLTFIARDVPDLLKPTYSFGGLSMSQMAKPYVDNWLQTRQGVNDIINSFSQMVLSTDLEARLQMDGDQLFNRVALFNLYRSNQGTMVINKDTEDFKNVAAPISGLAELQSQAQEHMASVSHIPVVKLFGIQPAGLGADSDGVMRSFYDYINSCQEQQYRGHIHRLMGLVMLSLWGEVDKDISFKFEPLWSLDEKGVAEVEKVKAETGDILIANGSISPEEERQRVASDPGSDYASIDVSDVPDLNEEEENGLVIPGGSNEGDENTASDLIFGKEAA